MDFDDFYEVPLTWVHEPQQKTDDFIEDVNVESARINSFLPFFFKISITTEKNFDSVTCRG